MKSKIYYYPKLVLAIILFTSIQSFSQDGAQLFDDSYVHTIEITFYESDFWQLLEQDYEALQNTGQKTYRSAMISIDGNILDTVGVRQKGSYSNWGFPDELKKPLKVDINEFVSGQKYDGIKKFNLANGAADPTMLRNKLSYNILQEAGVIAPRSTFAKVYLDGTYWGLYELIEQVDKTFLKNRFQDGSGNLWKSRTGTSLQHYGNNISQYKEEFDLKTNEDEDDWDSFIRLTDILNNTPNADMYDSLSNILNIEKYTRVLAVDMITNNWDSQLTDGRNFYLYFIPDQSQFYWIPWDYNFSFYDEDFDLWPENFDGQVNPHIQALQNNDQLAEIYYQALCEILDDNFTNNRLDPLIDSWANLIRDDLDADNNKLYTIEQFDQNIHSNVSIPDWSPPGLKSLISQHHSTISTQLANLYNCNTTSLTEQSILNSFSIFPNPASDYLIIQNEHLEGEQTIASIPFSIYNTIGQTLIKGQLDTSNQAVYINSLSSGVYFLKIEGLSAKKFIVGK